MFIIFYTVKSVYLVYLWLVSHPIVFVADRSGSAVLGVGCGRSLTRIVGSNPA